MLCIQSDLLGAAAVGIKNLICITGDPPKMGNYPDATAVFDVDAIGFVNIVHSLNLGWIWAGTPLAQAPALSSAWERTQDLPNGRGNPPL